MILMMLLCDMACEIIQESAEDAVSPIPCNLGQADSEEETDPLQFLVPLQHDSANDDGVDEAYSVPLNMRRPRSDSGSRYLTDDVCYFHSYFVPLYGKVTAHPGFSRTVPIFNDISWKKSQFSQHAHLSRFWPTVLSVEPMVQYVVCLSSVCRL